LGTINKDQTVLAEGRKTPLKDVDAPLRDQIVSKLLDKCRELEVGKLVWDNFGKAQSDRTTWLERNKAWLSSLDEFLVSDTDGAFTGASQLHIPMPQIVIKTFHARMYQAIMGVDPPFHAKARNEASMEQVPTVQDTMRWYLQDGANYGKGVDETVDRWIWDWCSIGTGILKLRWDVTYERFVDVETTTEPGTPIVQTIGGKEQLLQTTKQVEREKTVTQKTFEGPVWELVDHEDFCVVGGGGDPDHPDANVFHRHYLNASDLWTYADRKIFDYDAVERVISGGPQKKSAGLGNDIKVQRAEDAARSSVETENQIDSYEIVEAYLRKDVDGSGIHSNIVVWVHLKTMEILRATYLRRINPSGERPFAKILFQPRKGQEMGIGLLEMLYPLSQEMDAIHNMRIDFGLVSVMPFGFYRASSSIDPTTIKLEPGALIPVDNPQTDVFFPNLGNRTVFGMQEEQAIQSMIERLTSINDANLGVINGQGMTRTATGAKMFNSEMSSNLDIYLKRLNRGWKKALRFQLHLLQHRVPVGLSYRLTGEDGKDYWTTIKSSKQLEGDYDIEVTPNSESSNQQVQVDKAQQILQIQNNPLLIQMGMVGQPELYEGAKNYFQALGIKDWRRFLAKQDPNVAYAKLTPEQEANLVLHGIDVPVLPQMDHQGFINYFQMFHDTDELCGQVGLEHMKALAAQAQKHAQMLKATQQQQAQAANVQQQQTNAMQNSAGPNPGGGISNDQVSLGRIAPSDMAPQAAPGQRNLGM
jgi:hypothetical protein